MSYAPVFRPTTWVVDFKDPSAAPVSGLCVVGVFPDGTLTHTPQGDKAAAMANIAEKSRRLLASKEMKLWDGDLLLIKMESCRTAAGWTQVGGALWPHISAHSTLTLALDALPADTVRQMLLGLRLRSWHFGDLQTQASPKTPDILTQITCLTSHGPQLTPILQQDLQVCQSVHWARWITQLPGNIITPGTFVRQLEQLNIPGLEVSYLTRQEMENQGFGALLGVAQGSHNDPYLAILRWQGAAPETAPWAFVGKGVTFDSGGLSIKPSNGMEEMHMDKAGAGAVCGLMRALACLKAKVNAVGVVALVENMPSGTAQRPGDVVTSLMGKTIKVLNTDAEGRLILADALTYTQRTYRPHTIIDLATLTGAIRVALGSAYAGLFAHNDALADRLIKAGQAVGERLWRLPLDPAYDKAIRSKEADLQNIASAGVGAGSSTAAQFLAHFVDHSQTAWAHLDIAAVEFQKQGSALCAHGCTGFGVRLLLELLGL